MFEVRLFLQCVLVDFDEFDEILRKKIEEVQNHLLQKSNIKDVCALLDMKSSTVLAPLLL